MQQIQSIQRRARLWGALLLALLALTACRGRESAPVVANGGAPVGAYGPVGLVFEKRPPGTDLSDRLRLQPEEGGEAVPGRLEWSENTAWFWPEKPLRPDQTYTLRLDAQSWTMRVRQAEVAYLAPLAAAEVWRSPVGGGAARRLTSTGGKVYDFAVSRSGERVAYSSANELQGLDLWETGRDGGEPRLLLACGADRCAEPVYSPDGRSLAYSRGQASGLETYRRPAAWILDLGSLDTRPAVADPGVGGSGPLWSPDGQWLAFYDERAALPGSESPGVIWVVDREGNGEALPSNGGAPGSWSPDGRALWFAGARLSGEEVVTGLFAAEITPGSQTVRPVAWAEGDLNRFGRPAWSPDGRWVAVSAGGGAGAGVRLWRFSPDGSENEVLAGEPFFTYGHYSWDPGSEMLVFQRLEQGIANSVPQVAVWRAGQVEVVAEEGALPFWIP